MKAAGHPDLHLNLVLWQRDILWGEKTMEVTPALLDDLGFDSITSYVWIHHVPMEPFPTVLYLKVLGRMLDYTREIKAQFPQLPYFPNITMGCQSTYAPVRQV